MTSRPLRQSDPSYELIPPKTNGSILYRQHGFPDELVRWHYHKEYELHLITHSTGKVFVGDYIGNFYPGNLILTGPNLPHNWISHTDEQDVYPERDRVVVFTDEVIQSARQVMPEFGELDDLLYRSRFGIQFEGRDTIRRAYDLMDRIAHSDGWKAWGTSWCSWTCWPKPTTTGCCRAKTTSRSPVKRTSSGSTRR